MKNRQRNFWIHSVEGGVYMGGMVFLSNESVMPAMIHALGGPPWMVAAMPVLLVVGFYLPGIFMAPIVDRMPRLFPFVMICGVFQRLPYLLAALAMWRLTDSASWIILWIAFSATLFSGLIGGVSSTAWMEMVTRMVPEKHRASGWAIRNIIKALIGVPAGLAVYAVLKYHPGRPGYAILHGIVFILLMVSFTIMAFMKEPKIALPSVPVTNYWKDLKKLPGLLLAQSCIRKYVGFRMLGTGCLILAPFLAIHVLEVTGRSEAALGYLVAFSLIGGILGNFMAAFIGHHQGGKRILILARILQLILCVQLLLTTHFIGFCASFFLFGFIYALENVGDMTLGVELCPLDKRPFFIAGLGLAAVFGMLFTTGTGAVIEYTTHSFTPAIYAAAISSILSLVLICRIHEPRGRNAT
jgi:MFS family permease